MLRRIRIPILIGLVGWLACEPQESTGPRISSVELARGGGGGGPGVTEVDPPWAEQDTTLDVRIIGSGFDASAAARFTLDGVPTDSVRTNSTTFVSSTELVANITVDSAAIVDLYDVEVQLSGDGPPGKKKGVGVDLFAVTEKDTGPPSNSISTTATLDPAAGGLTGDGQGAYMDGSVITSVIRTNTNADQHYEFDANGGIRFVHLEVRDSLGAIVKNRDAPWLSLHSDNTAVRFDSLSIGQSTLINVGIRWEEGGKSNNSGDDWILRYGADCSNVDESSDANFITVRREADTPTGARVWTLETRPGTVGHLCTPQATRPPGPRTDLGPHTAPFAITLIEQN